MKIDKKIIKELSDYLDEFNLTEIEYSENNVKYKVSKSSKGVVREQIVSTDNQSKPSSAASTITSENINKANIIKSPMVGTAYLAPEPGAKPFVTVGANIKKGQTIIIIEAMKTMNHVPSTKDGVVKKILVTDGEAVEFDQDLILVE
ncbi:MAG: acetyl-CoA carboxylase biotin carboxyl carrier protein [Candidatus Fonsibacter ubiquis]|jgi:acetyl-CoA carboxylase biotin carboxyl carrier protein|nr:acetyl-CoA carboxylase biotin carboxyl carrier protein [Candidatus Fonsibacter ubiquis]NCU75180.1 acetyl-CoA carboxylase biotin carboxyl carrier protein [Candidatus Fonsibacter ubiquis]NDD06861.1 acetyl-CoA carboxylase biotin carboxyl carrier protein [Pseudomonadota bacterium]GBL33719.1 biotin carboxyl carrier protein of acetyl-CoA carboxylase [Pelagibacterales bacterium]